MRYPNKRYAPVSHLQHEALGWTNEKLAEHLRRDERTIRDWLSGRQKVPWWVPEILRLERYEKHHQLRRMLSSDLPLAKLGIVEGGKVVPVDTTTVHLRNSSRRKNAEKSLLKKAADAAELRKIVRLKVI